MKYSVTIGLEVHAELKTSTKLFCNSKNDPDETEPNINICPICMGHPGVLPSINKTAIRHVVRIGCALGGQISDYTEFDRKNYFYPDIPKGYQISQYEHPLVKGGTLAGVELTRVHLEEDTARSIHTDDASLIDFNRAGVPLMELVTEPTIHSAKEAGRFARELQLLLRFLKVSDAHMEKGEMRVEANISVSKNDTLGTKVEVKNLNSFRSVERSIEYEIKRHTSLLEKGEKVVQETRGWDEAKQTTFPQRLKEESHDYRYFPDPDIPKLKLTELKAFDSDSIKKSLPELPWERRNRYIDGYKLSADIAGALIRAFYADQFFTAEIQTSDTTDPELIRAVANYVVSEIPGALQNEPGAFGKIEQGSLIALAEMKKRREVSSRGVKDILAVMIQSGGAPKEIADKLGLIQKSDTDELKAIIAETVAGNESVVLDYKAGKEAALQYLVGQGMKLSKGSADPSLLKHLFEEELRS